VSAVGGAGGFGGLGGGNGGDATATGTATGGLTGASVVINGVFATGGNTWGGTAGSGTATATATGTGDGHVSIGAEANGGFATGGSGGLADVTATSHNSGTGTSSVSTIARGGNVGSSAGQGGNAIASSTANGELGATTATATAQSGTSFGGAADGMATATSLVNMTGATRTSVGTANSSATGGGGSASSTALGMAGFLTQINVQATAPVAGGVGVRSTSESVAGMVVDNTGFLPGPGTYLTREAVAYAAGDPNFVPGLNGNNPTVLGAMGSAELLVYGIMGGSASTVVDGGAHTYTSILDFDLDMSGFSGDRLLVGLLDPVGEGSGFDSLRFRIFLENNTVLDQNFTTLANALSFFDDKRIDLGDWTSGLVGDLDLGFQLDITASVVNDGFHLNLVAGVVPVPPSVWLFGSGLLGMIGIARRKKAA